MAGITPATVALLVTPTRGTGLPPETSAATAEEFTTVPVQRLILSKETPRLLVDTLNHMVRAAPTRAPSAATTMADRQRAIRHAEAPASVAEDSTVAVVDLTAVAGTINSIN